MRFSNYLFFIVLLWTIPVNLTAREFVHPGILHNTEALVRIKAMVQEGREPWKAAYDLFNKDSRASFEFKVNGPYEFVARTGSNPGEGNLHKKSLKMIAWLPITTPYNGSLRVNSALQESRLKF